MVEKAVMTTSAMPLSVSTPWPCSADCFKTGLRASRAGRNRCETGRAATATSLHVAEPERSNASCMRCRSTSPKMSRSASCITVTTTTLMRRACAPDCLLSSLHWSILGTRGPCKIASTDWHVPRHATNRGAQVHDSDELRGQSRLCIPHLEHNVHSASEHAVHQCRSSHGYRATFAPPSRPRGVLTSQSFCKKLLSSCVLRTQQGGSCSGSVSAFGARPRASFHPSHRSCSRQG
eukprot:scaffold3027_cov31-Tisochrysis_lutea.AAC.2